MTPTAKRLHENLTKATAELAAYRNKCKHRHQTKTPRSNTGNYDPSADRYWYDHECLDCGKKWVADQRTGEVLW